MTQINIYDADKFTDDEYLADLKQALESAYGIDLLDDSIFEKAMEERADVLDDVIESLSDALTYKNDRNPHWGNSILVHGSISRWNGTSSGFMFYDNIEDALDCSPSRFELNNVFADCEIDKIYLTTEGLHVRGHHHDGGVSVCMRQLTDLGQSVLGELVDGYIYEVLEIKNKNGDVIAAFEEDEEPKLLDWLWNHDDYSSIPQFAPAMNKVSNNVQEA